jgi:putative component of toxin-antitoxin plasmid stabilization module
VVRGNMSIKINTKIYTSIEEVVSDYTNNDNFNTLIFYKGTVSVPVKLVNKNGTNSFKFFDENPSDRIKLVSLSTYLKRNFLVKASTITPIMEKWSNLRLKYWKEVGKIVDFIKEGGFSWIANVLRGFDSTDTKFMVTKSIYNKHLGEVASLMNSLGKDTLSPFFEKAFELAWEEDIKYWISNGNADSLDFNIGEEEESFTKAAKGAEDFLRDPKSIAIYPIEGVSMEKLIAIFSKLGKEEAGKLFYGKTWDFTKTNHSPWGNIEGLKLIEKEKARYEKMGALPLFPEVFYFKVDNEEEDPLLYEFLSILQSKPETTEIGLVLVGHGEVSEKYMDFEAFFVPFMATKSRTALKLFVKALEYDYSYSPVKFQPRNYNPAIVAYESESSKKEKPKFQIFSFSYGPMIDIKSPGDEKEIYLYAPMVEHVFHPQKGERLTGARRVFVENPSRLKEVYNEDNEERFRHTMYKVIDLIDIPSRSRSYTRQVVEVDLTERNKLVEMVGFVGEMLKRYKKYLDKKNSEIVLRNPEEVRGKDEIEERIIKDLCYFGDGERVYVKAISGGLTEEEKNILKMGATVIGNLRIETSKTENTFSEKVENLYDVILASIKRISSGDDEGEMGNFGTLLKFIGEISEMSKKVGEGHRVAIVRDGYEEIHEKIEDRKINLIRNSEKMPGFGVVRMAREVFPKLTRGLKEINGPNVTVIIDYSPGVKLYLLPEDCVGEGGEEYDLETLIEEGCDPQEIRINSVLERAVIFLDFKEEGLRVASINLSRF